MLVNLTASAFRAVAVVLFGTAVTIAPASLAASISTRPAINTVANLESMAEACRGTIDGLELVRDVANCLSYLDGDQYLYISESNNSWTGYLQPPHSEEHQHPLIDSSSLSPMPISTKNEPECPGEIFEYHAYWSGPFTWRVELFMKAYLFTQNIKCSRLTIWLDETNNADIVQQVLNDDRVKQFTPLLRQDLLRIKGWTLPGRVFLPADLDHNDGYGFIDNADRRGRYADSPVIADAVQRSPNGQVFLRLDLWGSQEGHSITSMSDVFRFYILHVHGGVYLDIDMLLLRDLRPLLMSKSNFAERWGALSGQGDFNTGVLALQANSSLSAFLMRAGTRQGMYFHPRAMGHYLLREGRVHELTMLESATFDPVWPSFAQMRDGKFPEPCFDKFIQFFKAASGPDLADDGDAETKSDVDASSLSEVDPRVKRFFTGAFTYHIHNLWKVIPEPGSWLQIIMSAHDDFFAGRKSNIYGEWWDGMLGDSLLFRDIC